MLKTPQNGPVPNSVGGSWIVCPYVFQNCMSTTFSLQSEYVCIWKQ